MDTAMRHTTSSLFQSTLPAGEATWFLLCWLVLKKYFNPRFPRGKRRRQLASHIQAPISIHASRGGSDHNDGCVSAGIERFQSTLPAGEATGERYNYDYVSEISIHASRGGSDAYPELEVASSEISIHASRGGSDAQARKKSISGLYFNPRFPRGKRQ